MLGFGAGDPKRVHFTVSLNFFFLRGVEFINLIMNTRIFFSHPYRSLASTSHSVLGFGAGDPKCVHITFYLFFFVGEEFINSIMNTRIFPHPFTVVWPAQVEVCWALVQEIPSAYTLHFPLLFFFSLRGRNSSTQ